MNHNGEKKMSKPLNMLFEYSKVGYFNLWVNKEQTCSWNQPQVAIRKTTVLQINALLTQTSELESDRISELTGF